MSKNRTEIIHLALRKIKVISANEAADADMVKYVGDVLDLVFSEINPQHTGTITWTLADVPTNVAQALSLVLASDIADQYSRPPVSRVRALGRLRSVLLPDDRADRRDYDEDGTVTDAEADASASAAYY